MEKVNAQGGLSDVYEKKWANLLGQEEGGSGTQATPIQQGEELFRTQNWVSEPLLNHTQTQGLTTEMQEIKEQMHKIQSSIDRLIETVREVSSRIESIEEHIESEDTFGTMLASEEVLRRDWESPEDEEAWADL
jgi:hypothetical protein